MIGVRVSVSRVMEKPCGPHPILTQATVTRLEPIERGRIASSLSWQTGTGLYRPAIRKQCGRKLAIACCPSNRRVPDCASARTRTRLSLQRTHTKWQFHHCSRARGSFGCTETVQNTDGSGSCCRTISVNVRPACGRSASCDALSDRLYTIRYADIDHRPLDRPVERLWARWIAFGGRQKRRKQQ